MLFDIDFSAAHIDPDAVMTYEAEQSSHLGLSLENFFREGTLGLPHATGMVTSLLEQLTLSAKLIAARIRRAGLAQVLGYTGATNVQGEKVQKLDKEANDTMLQLLARCRGCAAVASEEEETLTVLTEDPRAPYLVLFDPLDGSSNIDVNVSIGTIFGVLKKNGTSRAAEQDFLKPGRELVAAGYVIYGPSTILVLTAGEGVYGFTLDPIIGEFFLTHENMRVPKNGAIYSISEANEHLWDEPVKNWVRWLKRPGPDGELGRTLRWVGTLVADAHRTLLRGGVFAYPADKLRPQGRLRLLYEANPLAFIFEAAGGAASTGMGRILDLEPAELHQRTPLVFGSREEVATCERFLRNELP